MWIWNGLDEFMNQYFRFTLSTRTITICVGPLEWVTGMYLFPIVLAYFIAWVTTWISSFLDICSQIITQSTREGNIIFHIHNGNMDSQLDIPEFCFPITSNVYTMCPGCIFIPRFITRLLSCHNWFDFTNVSA